MTKVEAARLLFSGTNWSCESIAFLLCVPAWTIAELAIEDGDRRATEDASCIPREVEYVDQ